MFLIWTVLCIVVSALVLGFGFSQVISIPNRVRIPHLLFLWLAFKVATTFLSVK